MVFSVYYENNMRLEYCQMRVSAGVLFPAFAFRQWQGLKVGRKVKMPT